MSAEEKLKELLPEVQVICPSAFVYDNSQWIDDDFYLEECRLDLGIHNKIWPMCITIDDEDVCQLEKDGTLFSVSSKDTQDILNIVKYLTEEEADESDDCSYELMLSNIQQVYPHAEIIEENSVKYIDLSDFLGIISVVQKLGDYWHVIEPSQCTVFCHNKVDTIMGFIRAVEKCNNWEWRQIQ